MHDRVFDNYELLELDEKPVFERSYLYSLEPIGIGTIYTESLTSYISRLANKHNITVYNLITKIILYVCLVKKNLPAPAFYSWYTHSYSLNGFSKNSFIFVSAIAELTKREDLSKLTLNSWVQMFSAEELFKHDKYYCPACYQDQKNNNIDLYDPLLFSLKLVNMCPLHKVKLLSKCIYEDCQKPQLLLASNSLIGYCQHCYRWLGKEVFDLEKPTESEIAEQQYLIEQLGKLITFEKSKYGDLSSENIISALKIVKTNLAKSIVKLSKIVNVSNVTIHRWCKGETLPSLGNLMRICSAFNISLVAILTCGEIKKINKAKPEMMLLSCHERAYKYFDKDILRSKLEVYLDDDGGEPPSLSSISTWEKIPDKTLRKWFPDVCEKIVSRRKNYISKQAVKKKNELVEFVRDIVVMLYDQGKYPSATSVMEYLPSPAMFKTREVYKTWKETLIGLGINKPEEY